MTTTNTPLTNFDSFGKPIDRTKRKTLTLDKHPVWTIAFGIIVAQVLVAVVAGIILAFALHATSNDHHHSTNSSVDSGYSGPCSNDVEDWDLPYCD